MIKLVLSSYSILRKLLIITFYPTCSSRKILTLMNLLKKMAQIAFGRIFYKPILIPLLLFLQHMEASG